MKPNNLERREQPMVKWAQGLFMASLGLVAWTLFSTPASASYIGFVILIALSYSFITVIGWKRHQILLTILGPVIVVIGEIVLRRFFPNDSSWMRAIQYVSIILAIFFGIVSILGRSKYFEK
jgi:uncharacterized membrane protein HdeD (DUF308 family)